MYQNKIEKNFTEQDFRNFLVNRTEIEKVLGLKIKLQKNNYNQYLEDYSLFPELRLHDVVCIFLGLHPQDWNAEQHPRYETIYNAIQQLAKTGKIKATVKKDVNSISVFLPHETARAIAKSQGLGWNVPPYKEIVMSDTLLENNTQSDDSEKTIQQQADQITELQAQLIERDKIIAEFKCKTESQNLKKNEVVNYDECSIYGHSTQSIKAIFGTIQRFWINADLTQPDTVANAEDIEQWIADNYDLSNTLKKAIQKITRPEEARSLGRKS